MALEFIGNRQTNRYMDIQLYILAEKECEGEISCPVSIITLMPFQHTANTYSCLYYCQTGVTIRGLAQPRGENCVAVSALNMFS